MIISKRWLALGGILIGLLLVGGLWLAPRLKPVATPPAQTVTPTEVAPMEASPALGPEDAPVTIIEYADFGCPSCWYWYKKEVLNALRAKYGDQIRFVWRDFPVITLLSPKAAEAGQCAHEQGKFWEFHDAVYESRGAIEASDLQAYAVGIGLDLPQFEECVTSRRYRDRVNAEQHEGFQRGITGTPTFFVNDQAIVGPQDLSVFEALIDKLLAEQK
jgi:protein-disulfide isomerase